MQLDFDHLLAFIANVIVSYISDEKLNEQQEAFVDELREFLVKWCV